MTRDQLLLTDYLTHITDAIEWINNCTINMDEVAFFNNRLVRDSVIRD
jgi:uncharacterized protein with HEPN domain